MKKLLVITIIACVSSSAFARRGSTFLGEFDGLLANYLKQASANAANKSEPDSEEVRKQKEAIQADALKEERQKRIDAYTDADNERAANSQILASNHNWRLLTAQANGAAKYTYDTKLAQEYSDINLKNKTIINNRTRSYEAQSKRNFILDKSKYQKEAKIGVMQDQTDVYVTKQKEMGLRDAAREEECVKKINRALQYGFSALEALDSSWESDCPAAADLIANAQAKSIRENQENYDYGIAANGWSAEDYTTNN
jgi:hypothetical protein